MSSIRNLPFVRLVALAVALVLTLPLVSSCGFQPLYGESARGDVRLLRQVQINRIDDRTGQKLRTMLRQKFGQRGGADKPRWSLTVTLRESLRGLAVQRDATTTRRELGVTAQFQLVELNVKEPHMFEGRAISVNSFNELASEFATLSAENDARNRALRILSDEIMARVMSALKNSQFMKKQARLINQDSGRRHS